MGLSGRKTKQRIGADPRNLTWSDDAAKFGTAYLSKLGWDPSRGLGVEGDGRTTHIKVAQKLNLLGIGAGAKQGGDKEGIAWKQNREYEVLLKRLNEAAGDELNEASETVDALETKVDEERTSGKKDKKRKRSKSEKEDGKTKECKNSKKGEHAEIEDGQKKTKKNKDKKKKRKSKDENESESSCADEVAREPAGQSSESSASTSLQNSAFGVPALAALSSHVPQESTSIARPRAHRARFLRSKQLASRSQSAVAEILGISPSTAATISSFTTPGASGSTTPPGPISISQTDQELTTATQSVGDYFKAKLAARKALGRPGLSTPVDADSNQQSRPGGGAVAESSRPRSEDTEEREEGPARVGLGAASRLGLGAAAAMTVTPAPVAVGSSFLSPHCKGLESGSMRFGGLMGSISIISSSLDSAVDVASTPPLGADSERNDGNGDEVKSGVREVKKKKEKRKEKRTKKDDSLKEVDEPEDGEDGRKRKKKRRKDSPE